MALDTVAERDPSFNQSSSSSSSSRVHISSELLAKLESVAILLAKVDALSSVAMRDAFLESSVSERHHFLAGFE